MDQLTTFIKRLSQIFSDQILGGKALSKMSIEETINAFLKQENIVLSRAEQARLVDHFVERLLNVGPLEPLLQDPDIPEIMVNRYDEVFVERRGKLEETDIKFDSEEHLMQVINQIAAPLGRVVNESVPIVDLRLADGTRVNIVIPPIALRGASMVIRRLPKTPITIEQLISWGSMSPEILEYIRACVLARLNMVIAGGTGSGKTTILNRIIGLIPQEERLVTVEGATELRIDNKHVVRLEARPPNVEGKGEITMRDLVINSLKMRPERIIVSEVAGGEVLDIIQAMNTGHDGSMFSMHANTARDALNRLEVMATMAGVDMPLLMIREQMASALQIIITQQRLRDDTRKIINITEIVGMKANAIEMQDIFEFRETGEKDGRITGYFTPTGNIPHFMDRFKAAGITFPADFFTPRVP